MINILILIAIAIIGLAIFVFLVVVGVLIVQTINEADDESDCPKDYQDE